MQMHSCKAPPLLHISSGDRRTDVARLQIEHGAEVEAKDNRGRMTPQLKDAMRW